MLATNGTYTLYTILVLVHCTVFTPVQSHPAHLECCPHLKCSLQLAETVLHACVAFCTCSAWTGYSAFAACSVAIVVGLSWCIWCCKLAMFGKTTAWLPLLACCCGAGWLSLLLTCLRITIAALLLFPCLYHCQLAAVAHIDWNCQLTECHTCWWLQIACWYGNFFKVLPHDCLYVVAKRHSYHV